MWLALLAFSLGLGLDRLVGRLTTPAGEAGPAVIIVTNPDGQADTLGGAFTFLDGSDPEPEQITVTNADPADGFTIGGTIVGLTGTGFVPGATVSFGGVMWTVCAESELAAMLPVTDTPSSC